MYNLEEIKPLSSSKKLFVKTECDSIHEAYYVNGKFIGLNEEEIENPTHWKTYYKRNVQDNELHFIGEWKKWYANYPNKNGIYIVVLRKTKEVWCCYWDNNSRVFQDMEENFKPVDVDLWTELPSNPYINY